MRLYSAESMEALRARKLVKGWTADGLLSEEQKQRLDEETTSGLRTTNIFLRGVLFFFTLIIIAAGTGLLFAVFLRGASDSATGVVFLVLALIGYAGAEMAVAQARLFHHGIEEALAACAVGFLFAGLQLCQGSHAFKPEPAQALIPVICGVLCLWIWHRFGYWYMFLAAMIFVVSLPYYWMVSPWAEHGMIAAIYIAGLVGLAALHPRRRFDYLQNAYSLAEALLWMGIYLALNLKISAMDLSPRGWFGTPVIYEFPQTFYWLTWVLTWCLPPIVLARGLRQKDRFLIAVGLLVAVLTLVTNKPYLGWHRHTWDPMLLGVFLAGAVLWIQRWLARGPGGVREGFTAARLSSKDKSWMSAGTAALGLIQPHSITPEAQPHGSGMPDRGGSSGGGGASRDF